MVTRIGGLASGMDIDSLVANLLKAERMPLDKMKQKKQILEWQRDDYRSINSLMLTFRNSVSNMKLTSNYRTRSVSVSDDTKVSATATSAASNTSYTISKVDQLAKAEMRKNGDFITSGKKLDQTKSIYGQADDSLVKSPVWETGALITKTIDVKTAGSNFKLDDTSNVIVTELSSATIKVNGKAYTVVTNKDELNDNNVYFNSTDGSITFKNSIPAGSSVTATYIGKKRSDQIQLGESTTSWKLSQAGVDELKITLTTIKGENVVKEDYQLSGNNIENTDGIKIGTIDKETGVITFEKDKIPKSTEGTTYTLSASYDHKYMDFSIETNGSTGEKKSSYFVTVNDTLDSVISKVNGSAVGVNMFYDSVTGKMTMTRSETGKFGADGTNDIKIEGSFITDVLNFGGGTTTAGQNAKFVINGLETNRTSNTFQMNGVTFTLKQTFTESETPVSVGVSNDTTAIYDNIKKFIDEYNALVDTIQGKLNETRNRSYQPLTDEEREALSDKEQEKWDNIAKTGLLRRDPTLSSVLSGMRTDFYGTVNNSEISSKFNQLAKIGINTSIDYTAGGRLEINEAKLKTALEEDPSSVEQLFRGEDGILNRLISTVTTAMDNLRLKAGNSNSTNQTFTIGRELDSIAKQEDRFETRLTEIEARYWRQFSAMEAAIQRSNEQSSYLMQFMGG